MTTKIKPLLAALAALLAAGILTVVASGCGDNTTTSSSVSGNAADAAFVNDMVPHHQGAIDMAEIAQTKGQHPQIKALATGIIAAQKSEIAIMKKLQNDLHSVGGHSAHMGMSQSEMGMDGDMPMLENASQFDKAFIDMMIPHHQGAIRMARQQLPDGKLPALQTMARNIIKAQTAEIEQMRTWRKQWYGGSSTSDNGGSMMSGAPMNSN